MSEAIYYTIEQIKALMPQYGLSIVHEDDMWHVMLNKNRMYSSQDTEDRAIALAFAMMLQSGLPTSHE